MGKNNGENGFQAMSNESILTALDKQGALRLTRKSLPDDVVVEAVRDTGLPSEFIDAPGGTGGVAPLGNDPETQRIVGMLEAAVRGTAQGPDAPAAADGDPSSAPQAHDI